MIAGYMIDVMLLRNFPVIPNGTNYLTPLHPLLVLETYLNQANYQTPLAEDLVGYSSLSRFYLSNPLQSTPS